MSADACSSCGRPFLVAADLPSVSLPVVGDVRHLDKAQKLLVYAGGVIGMTALLTLLLFLIGSL
jgi:hypothetical protein